MATEDVIKLAEFAQEAVEVWGWPTKVKALGILEISRDKAKVAKHCRAMLIGMVLWANRSESLREEGLPVQTVVLPTHPGTMTKGKACNLLQQILGPVEKEVAPHA